MCRCWSHPHGCVSWNLYQLVLSYLHMESHPHGCVSWNLVCLRMMQLASHTLTGVWVEMLKKHTIYPVIFMSHPHGCVSWNRTFNSTLIIIQVTPSRVCELKYSGDEKVGANKVCHTLTGVWVEIWRRLPTLRRWYSHTLTGVWVEIPVGYDIERLKKGHTLTGVWVEIPDNFSNVW